jgi:glycolate oxidase FAD binding subunit
LRPLPEETALVVLRCDTGQLAALLDQLHDSRTRPVAIDVLNPRAAEALPNVGAASWVVLVGFEEGREVVHWQVQQLIKELSPGKVQGLDVLAGAAATPLWQALTEFRLLPQAVLTFKANLLPHAAADFCRRADALAPAPLLQAHAGSGIVLGHVTGDCTLESAAALLHELHPLAAEARGNVVVLGCPPAWKATLPVWGLPRGDTALMRAVKDKLDPRGLFNPGRFLTR